MDQTSASRYCRYKRKLKLQTSCFSGVVGHMAVIPPLPQSYWAYGPRTDLNFEVAAYPVVANDLGLYCRLTVCEFRMAIAVRAFSGR